MKKQKIKVNGVRYKYIITEDNTLRFQEKKSETITVHYNEKYLERRFQKWSLVELKMYRDELEEKHKKGTITSEEILCVQPIREEIERRMNNDNKRTNGILEKPENVCF